MPKKKPREDRFLVSRNGIYYYNRRIPKRYGRLDKRYPRIMISLYTPDLALARIRRDRQEQIDEQFWSELVLGPTDEKWAQLLTAQEQARALGFSHRSLQDLIDRTPTEELLDRIRVVMDVRREKPQKTAAAVDALLGGAGDGSDPGATVKQAFDFYIETISIAKKQRKSRQQYRVWYNTKLRAVATFIEVVGDIPFRAISRSDARTLFTHYQDRIADGEILPSTAGRDFGNMRNLYREYSEYTLSDDALEPPPNPFARFRFDGQSETNSRPPFPIDWVVDRFLQLGALDGLNAQAQTIIWMLIETGARPSEICTLTRSQIRLDAEVPYIMIEPVFDKRRSGSNREIKSRSSLRAVPLVGISFEAAKRFPNGFDRYRENPTNFSNAAMKFLRNNGYFPSPAHSVYSFRHTMEKRMLEGGLDSEFRQLIFGHANRRPKYGDGGEMTWRRDQLATIALPYDPAILR